MHLRRDRVHHHGKTNKDFKMIDALEHSVQKESTTDGRIDSLAVSKPKKFSQLLEEKHKRVMQHRDPLEETKASAKKKYAEHKMGYPRFAQLEEKELRKRVFCGDSNTILIDEKARRLDQSPQHQRQDKEKLAFQKREENAVQIQETQLVGVGENKETLEGKVDLEKVREIRRAIRRRYANRKNFQKIFNLWDEDSNGAISVKNLFNMIQRLGIKINIDEARVLLASADRDGSCDLGLDEFLDLIFNDKDALNVNLQSLPALTEDEKDSLLKNQETIDFLRQDAQRSREIRHQNQVNLILKNRLLQLAQWLQQQDGLQKGYLNFNKFESVIKKLEVDSSIINEQDISLLYNKFKNSDDTFDYKRFVNHLKSFQLQEEVYRDPYEVKPAEEHHDKKQMMLMQMKNQESQKINVFDLTRVNGWHLERMKTRTKNLVNRLIRYLPTRAKFDEFLKSKIQQPELVNLQEFSHALIQFLESVNESYHRFDIESILSVVQFGQHECQKFDEVGRILYEESDQDFYDRAQLRKKAPPPPPEKALAYQQAGSVPQFSAASNEYFSSELGLRSFPVQQGKELSQVLMKVENAVFNKSEKAYKIFNEFDKDRDGYISHHDLKRRIQELNILSGEETQLLVNYLDPQNKGFATFGEFNNRIRAGMTTMDNEGNALVCCSVQPNKQTVLAAKQFLPELQRQTEQFKEPFRPKTNQVKARPSTRFGSTPPFKNTFEAFVPQRESPMFIGPDNRFNRNREQFQQDEKLKNQQVYAEKLNRIRSYQQEINHRIKSAQENVEVREQNHLKSKAMAQWAYEHKAHLQNDYL